MVTLLLKEASTSEEEHFKLMLVQTEMERAKYLVRSYLRTRLAKVSLTSQSRPLFSTDASFCYAIYAGREVRSAYLSHTDDATPSVASGALARPKVRPTGTVSLLAIRLD